MCHESCVTCPMSCHASYIFFYNIIKLVGGGSFLDGATPSFSQTQCSWGCSTNTLVINYLIKWLGHPFPPDFQITFLPKPKELGSWRFDRMFTPHQLSHVMCHMSRARCHVSGVRCPVSHVTCQVSCVTCHIFYSFLDPSLDYKLKTIAQSKRNCMELLQPLQGQ